MSVIIRLQGLPWSASALDIRHFFKGLTIPPGGVHIIGGERGDAFIAFGSDEDARQAMMRNMSPINGTPVQLFLSSKSEMQSVIEEARAVESGGAPAGGIGGSGSGGSGGGAVAMNTHPTAGLQQGMGQPVQVQGFPGTAGQRFPQPGGDSQFAAGQTFPAASQMQAQAGRDGQGQNLGSVGMNQTQAGPNSQYGFQPDKNQTGDGRFQSNQQDGAGYGYSGEGGYAGNDGQQWQGQGQGRDFQMGQKYYGDDQFQGRPGAQSLQQRPDQFPPGRDGHPPPRPQQQQPFPGQGGDPMHRQDPFAFNQQQSGFGQEGMQQGPDGPGRFPIKSGRPGEPEPGKKMPPRPGMPGFGMEQAPGRKPDGPGPRPGAGLSGMMRPDPQGQMRPDPHGPMRPDHSGPMRQDQPGPVRPDQPGPARLDPLGPGRSDRPESLLPDKPGPPRPDPQRPMRPDQPGLLEPRPGLLRGPAPGRPGVLPDDVKPAPGGMPDFAGRGRGRGMLPTPDIPPLSAKRLDDLYGDEAAMEQGRWPGYSEEEPVPRGGPRDDFREGGVDGRPLRRDPDLRRSEADIGRGRGQFPEGGDSDFRCAPRPGGRPFDGPDRRRFDGPGERGFDPDRRFEGPGGRRFDGPRGFEDTDRFAEPAERRYEDPREYEDVRDFDPRDRDFDRHGREFEGHPAGRGFAGPRGRGFPGRRAEGPRGRGFDRGGRGRGFDDAELPPYGPPGRREYDPRVHPDYPPYPMDEDYDRGHFEHLPPEDSRMMEREFMDDPLGRPYPPFSGETDFDDRRDMGRGRPDMGRGRMDAGRGRMDGGRGRFDGPGGLGRGMDTDRRWNGPGREDVDTRAHDPDRHWRENSAGGPPPKPGLLGDAPPGLLPSPDFPPDDERDSRSRDSDVQRDRDRRSYSERRDRDDRDRVRDDRSSRRSDRSHDRSRGRDSRSSERSSHRDRDHRRDRDKDRDRDRSSNRDRHSDIRSRDRKDKSDPEKKADDSKKSAGTTSKFIHAKNLPTSFNYKDIRKFFNGCELPFDGIKIINISGQRSGEAFLKFASEDVAKKAMKNNGQKIQGNTVSLTYVTAKDFETHMDSQLPPESGSDAEGKVPGAGQEAPPLSRPPEKSNLIVQVRGLPLNVKREDLVRFFNTVQIAHSGDAVFIEYDSRGQGTGIAYMEVASVQDFRTAMGYDGHLFGPRAIKLSVGRREDMDILIKKQQEMFQRQADRTHDQQSMGGPNQGPSLMGQRPPLLSQSPGGPRSGPQPLMSIGLLGPPPRNGPALMQTPSAMQQGGDKPQGGQPQSQSQELCVHIQGLPMLATQREIRDFFSDLNIVQRGIQIVHDGVGKPMGEGFVEFATPEDKDKALKKDKTSMGRHIVAVKSIAKADMIERLRNARLVGLPPGQGPPAPPPIMQPGGSDVRPKSIPPGVLNRQWTYLRCQNFPSNIGIAEIMNFFKGYRPVGESIRMHFLADGSPTGNAVVGFPTVEDANRALQDLNEKMCRQSAVLLQPAV